MRTLKFNIEGQRIKKNPKCSFSGLVTGNKGYLECEFATSKEWLMLAKVAVFYTETSKEYVPLINNRCQIPDSVTDSTRIRVGLVGRSGDTILMTNMAVIMQQKGALDA